MSVVLTAVLRRRMVSGETGNNQHFQTGTRDSALSIRAWLCAIVDQSSSVSSHSHCVAGTVRCFDIDWCGFQSLRGMHSWRVCAHGYTHSGTDTHCESLINFLCLYARSTSGILTSHTPLYTHTCSSQEWYHPGFRCPMGSWHTLLKSDCSPPSQLWLVLVFRANEMTDC